MNNKQSNIDKVMEIVVECCDVKIDGVSQITAEDVKGQCRRDNVCMTRCIFVAVMMLMGYSRSTIAAYLRRDVKSVGRLLTQCHEIEKGSRAFQFAKAEAILRTRELNAN